MIKRSALYIGQVMHARYFPMHYRFNYKVFSLLLDLDELESVAKTPLLSFNRFNLFSIYTKDHGARNSTNWRAWINPLLEEQGLSNGNYRIQLSCFPRILGYSFNPLSLWFCHDENEQLIAVICEVSNTFGEYHHYVLHNHNQPLELPVKANKNKIFHVSPFINMQQQYRFSIDKPDDKLRIVINEFEDDELMLVAVQSGKRHPIKTSSLLRSFFMIPLMTFKIMLMIHWQALKIWVKGGKFHRKPKSPIEQVS